MKRLCTILAAISTVFACSGNGGSIFSIGSGAAIDSLHAPWDGLDDNTIFRCFTDSDWFYFHYEVEESTLTLTEGFCKERDVDPEDRVEIFFSPREEMDIYYCAEIDPEGRIMDYKAKYYRDFDYEWDFSTMEVVTKISQGRYSVSGKVSKKELSDLEIVPGKPFRMGVFRADFRQDGSCNWYSAVPTEDKSPDFHKPDLLFSAVME
ncbi:MAG: hypothetical protein IJ795_05265 [Bacteroidales bacterium]|nr:hypothetical protein [Bacteroidales bacterium]